MLETLVPGEHRQRIDTGAAAIIVQRLLGADGAAPPPLR